MTVLFKQRMIVAKTGKGRMNGFISAEINLQTSQDQTGAEPSAFAEKAQKTGMGHFYLSNPDIMDALDLDSEVMITVEKIDPPAAA